jgi:hypothetical protein
VTPKEEEEEVGFGPQPISTTVQYLYFALQAAASAAYVRELVSKWSYDKASDAVYLMDAVRMDAVYLVWL